MSAAEIAKKLTPARPAQAIMPNNPFPRGSKWFHALNRLWALSKKETRA